MSFILSKKNVDLSSLSSKLTSNKDFATSLKISIRLMQNQWNKLTEIYKKVVLNQSLEKDLLSSKEKKAIIHKFAGKAYFINQDIVWENKTNQATESSYIFVLEVLQELNQLIEKYSLDEDREYTSLFEIITQG